MFNFKSIANLQQMPQQCFLRAKISSRKDIEGVGEGDVRDMS